jgi:hypothetical protein
VGDKRRRRAYISEIVTDVKGIEKTPLFPRRGHGSAIAKRRTLFSGGRDGAAFRDTPYGCEL